MSQQTRKEVLEKLRSRYGRAGRAHKSKIIKQVVELLGYHPKAAIRALGRKDREPDRGPVLMGRPRLYEPEQLRKPLTAIWLAANQPCGKLLAALMPVWVPGYEAYHSKLRTSVREQLLGASPATLDRLLAPVRVAQGKGRSGTKPGTLLRQQIPVRGGIWEEDKPGFLELDTVALCGGKLDDGHAWMLNGADICTTWVVARALQNRSEQATLEQIKDVEASLPFEVLGADSDNGGEFLNWHLVRYWQERQRPVMVTRSRPYHKDDNAHIEQKNWTHIRQWFGYERYDNPAVVPLLNGLCKGPWNQLLNYFCPSMKLQEKRREGSKTRRIYDEPKTPLARVLANDHVPVRTKEKLAAEAKALNPFALRREIDRQLRLIERVRTVRTP